MNAVWAAMKVAQASQVDGSTAIARLAEAELSFVKWLAVMAGVPV